MKYLKIKENKTIDNKIREKGITAIAKKAGIHRVYLHSLIKGNKVASQQTYEKIKKALNTK